MTPIQQLVTAMVARLQLAGLASAFYDANAKSSALSKEDITEVDLPPLLRLYRRLAAALELIEEANTLLKVNLPLFRDLPFLYNTQTLDPEDPWASRSVSGDTFSLHKILTGYAAIWLLQLDESSGAANRMLKAAVWLIERHGSVREGLEYLFALNRAGFVIKAATLATVIERLARLYARTNNLHAITQLTSSEADQKTADHLVDGLEIDKISEIGLFQLGAVLRAIHRCKAASDPNEWTAARAELSNLLKSCRNFERIFNCAQHWPLQYRIQYAALEEIVCDLWGPMQLYDCSDLEQLNLRTSWGMTSGLIVMLKDKGWLAVQQALSARVLLPDCLLPVVEQLFSYPSPPFSWDFEQSLPDAWRHHGKEVGHTIAILREINPQLLRWDPAALSEDEQTTLPEDTDATESEGSGGLAVQKDSDREKKKQETLEKHSRELGGLSRAYADSLGKNAELCSEILDFVLTNYPLQPIFLLERAIALDEAGSPEPALNDLLESLCLDPSASLPWQSFGVVCRRLGYAEDGAIASLIHKVLEERQNATSD